jgi:hypothetical protein
MGDFFDESTVSQEILDKFPKVDYKYLKLEKNASEGLITGVVNSLNQFLDDTVDAEEDRIAEEAARLAEETARLAEEAARLAKEEEERLALIERQEKAKREYDIENDVEWLKVNDIEGYTIYISNEDMTYNYAFRYSKNVQNGSLTGLTDKTNYSDAKNDVNDKIARLGLTTNEKFEGVYFTYFTSSNFFSSYKISDNNSKNFEYLRSSTEGRFAIILPAVVKRSVKKEEKKGVLNFLKKIIFSS